MNFWSFAKPFEDGSYDQAAWGDWHDKGPSMRWSPWRQCDIPVGGLSSTWLEKNTKHIQTELKIIIYRIYV